MSIVRKIVEVVAQVMPDRERDELIGQRGILGQPISRLDGRDKVCGLAKFTADYAVDGLVHAAIAYSSISKGTITAIEDRKSVV